MIHKALGGRFAGLGLGDRLHDAAQQAVVAGLVHGDEQQAVLVDAARPHGIAWAFVRRGALAGDGRLVDAAETLGDGAIQRNLLARQHAHDGVQRHGLQCCVGVAAIGLLHLGGAGGAGQQLPKGVAGAVHGLVFQALGGNVQGHHHGRLGPLANQKGPGHGHSHQGMDAQVQIFQIG